MPHKSLFSAPTPLQYSPPWWPKTRASRCWRPRCPSRKTSTSELDVQTVLSQIDTLGAKLKARVPADAAPVQRLRSAEPLLLPRARLAGNVNDYYDRRNSFINDVLAQRRGIRWTLALLYIELAGQLGLTARGGVVPGALSDRAAHATGRGGARPVQRPLAVARRARRAAGPVPPPPGLVGEFEAPLGCSPARRSRATCLARMLRNLKEIHRSGRDGERWLAVQERSGGAVAAELGRAARPRAGADRAGPRRTPRSPTSRPTSPTGADADDALAMAERLDELRAHAAPALNCRDSNDASAPGNAPARRLRGWRCAGRAGPVR